MAWEAELRPDLIPPFPMRRMIGVTVMFAGLIAPALYGAVRIGESVGLFFGLVLLVLAAWMGFNLRRLWKGEPWAYRAAIVLFIFGLGPSGVALTGLLLSGGWRDAALAAAAVAYFACGLGALLSLQGRWLQQQEWAPRRDPLASADKAAILKVLQNRAKGS
jgi:hypothetical protein